jgi:hypothetical protein
MVVRDAVGGSTVGWAGAVVKTGTSSKAGSGDGEDGNLIWVIRIPW